MMNKGEVWLANLNPNKGKEPGKTRPVLIVQDQTLLDVRHPATLIIPLSTQLVNNAEPLRIRVKASGKLKQDSDLLIDQVRSIDNVRLVDGPLTNVDQEAMEKIYNAVCQVMGMAT